MDFLDKVKSKLSNVGPDKPIDITQQIRQSMDRGAMAVSRDRTVAPNRFQIFLTPATDQAFTQWGKEALLAEFVRDAQLYAAEQSYSLVGSIQVELLPAPEGARRSEVKAHSVPSAQPVEASGAVENKSWRPVSGTSPAEVPSLGSGPAPFPAEGGTAVPGADSVRGEDSASGFGQVSVGAGNVGAASTAGTASTPDADLLQQNANKPLLEVIGDQTYLLVGQRSIVGRGSNVDIALNDSGVSHRHFEIVQVGPHYVLRDLGSTNGTYVEGNNVKEATLLDRNIIQAGRVKMIFWRQAADTEGTPQ